MVVEDGLVEDLGDRPARAGLVEQVGGAVDVVGAEHDVDVGRLLADELRSFWARQPATTICRSGRASFWRFRWPRLP